MSVRTREEFGSTGAASGLLARDVERLARAYEHGFERDLSLTIGVEEELILLDPSSLLPADEA